MQTGDEVEEQMDRWIIFPIFGGQDFFEGVGAIAWGGEASVEVPSHSAVGEPAHRLTGHARSGPPHGGLA